MTTTSAATIYEHMFRSFGLRENPFHVSPDPRFLYSGPAYETALAELMFGIEAHRGLLVMTGEAGTGKTTLMRHFLQWLKDRQFSSAYIFHTHLDPGDLFEFILRDFGVPVESTKKSDLLATLHRWLQARQLEGDAPVIVIDEAQALSLRTLGELNLLLNLENIRGKLVQLVLAGQPELEEKLRRPELRALRQRIMVRCRLPLLSLEETEEYIVARLRGAGGCGEHTFPAETVQTIYSYARGVPRIVNLLCEQALVGAYADRSKTVSPANVRRVAAEFDLVGEPFQATNLDFKFAPKFAAGVVSGRQPVAAEAAEVSARAESPTIEKVLAAAMSETVLPVAAVAQTSAGMSQESSRESPLDQQFPAHEVPIMRTEATQDSLGVDAAVSDSAPTVAALRAASPVLDVPQVGLPPEEPLPLASASIEGLSDEPVAAADHIAPVPAASGDLAPRQELSLHVVPPREKRGSGPQYSWRRRRTESSFVVYWREVAGSFVRDWRAFAASLAPQASAFAGHVPEHAASVRRKVLTPLREWLRAPMQASTPRQRDSNSHPTPGNKS